MNILIVNAYLRNTGDAALLSVTIDQLRKAWPEAHITVSSVEDPISWPRFEDCPNIGSIRLYAGLVNGNKLHRLYRKALVLLVEMTWGHLPTRLRKAMTRVLPHMVRQELQTLEATDLVLSTAGGYLNGADNLGGDLSVRYMLLPMKLASSIGKPVVLAPQSYGAFGNNRQINSVVRVLNKSQCIMTREGKSYDLLSSMGVKKDILVQSVDVAFAFEPRLKNDVSQPKKGQIKLGITTRSWLSKSQQRIYETALAEFIIAVQSKYDISISIISHVMKDVYSDDGSSVDKEIARLVHEAGAKVEQIDTLLDQHAMKKLYDNLDFIIGTRFHSVIFSLTASVPAIAIEYQHKTSGIMRDLGLSDWVVSFEDVTSEKLLDLFDRLVQGQIEYRQHIHKVLPGYIKQANETGSIIKQAYENWLNAVGNENPVLQK